MILSERAISRPTSTSPRRRARARPRVACWSTPTTCRASSTIDVAVLMLTHVNYRSGRMHDMAALTRVPTTPARWSGTSRIRPARCRSICTARGADFAVGCGYKYLNGGPGAPAFVWAHPRTRRGWIATAGASRSRAGSVTRRRSPSRRTIGRPRHRRDSSAARRRCCRWPRSNAASTPSLAAEARRHQGDAREVARADRPLHRAGRSSAAPATVSRSSRHATGAARQPGSFAHPTGGYASCRR